MVTESEYLQITQRIQESKKGLTVISQATNKEALLKSKTTIELECSKVSLKIHIIKRVQCQNHDSDTLDISEVLLKEMYP